MYENGSDSELFAVLPNFEVTTPTSKVPLVDLNGMAVGATKNKVIELKIYRKINYADIGYSEELSSSRFF